LTSDLTAFVKVPPSGPVGAVAWRERFGKIGFALGVAAAAGYALALRNALTLF
jgi:hypothetical protein